MSGVFSNDKTYFIPGGTLELLGLLNSKVLWWILIGLSPAVRDAWHELRVQYVETLPVPDLPRANRDRLSTLAQTCTNAAHERFTVQSAVRRRILDLAPPDRAKLTGKLHDWHDLDFAAFRAEVKRAFHAEIPLRERGEWEGYLRENAERVRELTERVAGAEREIDQIVYALFDLTAEEVELLEQSLKGQY